MKPTITSSCSELVKGYLSIPEQCFLGKKVFKKLFVENSALASSDKKIFQTDVETINWLYTLKPSTIQIQPYQDETCEYLEIAVLEVNLKDEKKIKRLAEVIHRSIPYPLVLIFYFQNTFSLSVASKRFSQSEKETIVVDKFYTTNWLDPKEFAPEEQAFLQSIKITLLPQTNFYAFYFAIIERFVALECARLTGSYKIELKANNQQQRRDLLSECHDMEIKIIELKAAIKKETQFNQQVALNTKIKLLEQELREKTLLL